MTEKVYRGAPGGMKVALVCDWLTNVGGAEKVLLAIHKMYPEAPIYTSQYSKKGIDWFDDADVRVGWMRIFPASWRRFLGWFRARYFAGLDLSDYDLVISVTGAEAKAVKTKKSSGGGAVHISYCHVPTQYYWQMYDEYVKNPGFGILNPLVRVCFKALVGPLRKRDFGAAQGVDQFVTISSYAEGLISRYYKRSSVVVHPPVEVEEFGGGRDDRNSERERSRESSFYNSQSDLRPVLSGTQSVTVVKTTGGSRFLGSEFLSSRSYQYYITTSRQVTWKRIDLCVKACVKLKRHLLVIGEGPEHERLMKMTEGAMDDEGRALVEFLPVMSSAELAEYLAGARGYLFPSLEPFGIAPVEALASGCPVIAYGEGGALDYVKDGENGVLFSRQSVASLVEAVEKFEKMKFSREKIARSVENFGVERFEKELREVIDEKTV